MTPELSDAIVTVLQVIGIMVLGLGILALAVWIERSLR